MVKVSLMVRIEKEIVQELKALVLYKHKKLKGGLSLEVEEAIKHWLELNKENLGVKDLFSTQFPMHNLQKKKGISSENRLVQIVNNIIKAMKEAGIEYEFSVNDWVSACYKVGYADYRTINKYLNVAEKLGIIANVRPGIYRLAGEKHE